MIPTRNRYPPGVFIVVILLAMPSVAFAQANTPAELVGNIAGVHFAVPPISTMFGINYAGEDVWTPRTTPVPPRTYASPIESFDLIFRLSDATLVTTPEERAAFEESTRHVLPFKLESWANVTVGPLHGDGAMSYVPATLAGERLKEPVVDPAMPFGLHHVTSRISAPNFGRQYDELYYDLPTHTVILSQTSIMVVPPYADLTQCDQYVEVRKLGVLIDVDYAKTRLDGWRRYAMGVRNAVSGLVQK